MINTNTTNGKYSLISYPFFFRILLEKRSLIKTEKLISGEKKTFYQIFQNDYQQVAYSINWFN